MKAESQRTCPSCGNEFSGAMEFCPVCMLRKGLAGAVASSESSFEEAAKPTPQHPEQRFEHYQLVTGEDGRPVELGHGAMGVTYKAFDADLQCPVSERYLGDESARLRFFAKPAQRYGAAGKIAGMAAYLAGPEAAYVTGASLMFDGGLSA